MTHSTRKYDEKQGVFCLSYASNIGAPLKGDPCEIAGETAGKLNDLLSKDEAEALIGQWEVVWGPGIFQAPCSEVSDNTMYVAKTKGNVTPAQYVVAIAGTNGLYDGLLEDLFLGVVIKWPYAHPESLTPCIAHGTYLGLHHLQGMRPCTGLPGAGLTLLEFLQGEFRDIKDNAEVIITGHSLGGTLSPVLTLWLADIKPQWDPGDKSLIKTYPSAGAAPGDKDFAAYYDSRLGGEDCAYTYRIWNDKDALPHAWNCDDLKKVPYLYTPEIEPNPLVFALFLLAQLNTMGHNYTQIVKDTKPLPGKTKNHYGKDPFESFLTEMSYQHVKAYFGLLKVEEFIKLFKESRKELFRLDLSDQYIGKIKEKLRKYRQ